LGLDVSGRLQSAAAPQQSDFALTTQCFGFDFDRPATTVDLHELES
jgi:hypothetical protein